MPAPPSTCHASDPSKCFRKELTDLLPELRARSKRLCADPAAADDVVQDTIERALKFEPVSYTHLDVYKRQVVVRARHRGVDIAGEPGGVVLFVEVLEVPNGS